MEKVERECSLDYGDTYVLPDVPKPKRGRPIKTVTTGADHRRTEGQAVADPRRQAFPQGVGEVTGLER